MKWPSRFPTVLVFPIIFSGCKTNDLEKKDLAGTYESKEYSQFELSWGHYISKKRFVIGSSLDLKEDSTFIRQSCVIWEGNWTVKNDSLFLHVNSSCWTVDSFNNTGFEGRFPTEPEEPVAYEIQENLVRLYMEDAIDHEGNVYDSVEELVKVGR